MKRKRKNRSGEEKVTILKRHLVDHVPVSDLCDEYNLHPTVFYRWQKEFFEHGAAAFDRNKTTEKKQDEAKIQALEQKLQRKNEVLSELMEEHVKLKKDLGEI
ncbi:transposase [Desulfopila sp. IMCC35008]|uniref:transposase n=1 Tax=Desulfopila sp. IMCC35008 TaxID=2653858 RepID=UPI0013D76F27|nr:transposase [Desulfopila sp. IMCC35008]